MIQKLHLTHFKNFQQATLELGGLSVLIGTNASGKSNIREAFRFLNGIARNYTLSEIFGGKWTEGIPQWKGIRGGFPEVCFYGTDSFSLSVDIGGSKYTIQIGIEKERLEPIRVLRESLSTIGEMIFDTHPDGKPVERLENKASLVVRLARLGPKRLGKRLFLSAYRPALLQIFNHEDTPQAVKADMAHVIMSLLSMRFIDLSPEAMREPANPGQTILGDRGENLSSVLQGICAQENLKQALLEWIRQLTPMDIEDFEFVADLTGKILLVIREHGGSRLSAHSVSDGTLRFLGLIAAIMSPQPSQLYFFEELENGIHPTRLGLLIKFMEQRLQKNKDDKSLQIVATTHSPQLLRFLSPENQEAGSLIYRLEDAPDAKIKRIMEIPQIKDVLKTTDLADLHESGWFENVVSFLADEETGT